MVQGFKDFIMRGNVVDLAVGIVVGAAFTGVVTGFTDGFIKPLIQLMGGNTSVHAGTFDVHGAKFDYATFFNAIITFLITAAVLYFLVVYPLNALAERRRRGEEPPPKTPSEEVALLTEIRDALVRGQSPTPTQAQMFDQRYGRHQEPPR
ncbi:large conductance mechanosensitive channel protein MscL [Actinoplanes sp. TBRC 11911]|uniref:large conductance mechanosensitive channel protein MscL n=1 Tax=Actinoplanes sp. TBRC 11911 TaxID=2729386 RepID=UPI00145D77A2|nr:large conductance mechanosensitive channel protein MscL [Actinoplanes sp. TBRC 11911]NMO54303.1 large conductance mechanosensitive channel protein MscL [Actinoplanes sp. TBRC 11911]